MIKMVLLTGFLGAGKTTFMKKILNQYNGIKTGVIVNEFGEVNIDAQLLKTDGIQMSELSNGSIFCACIKDKFVDSLIEMSYKDLDYVFIEASGLADPANMIDILKGIENNVLNPYEYKGSVCVLDGESFLDLYEMLTAIISQLEFAGAVVINKADLIDDETLKEIVDVISEYNTDASVYVTSYCDVNVTELVENLHLVNMESRETSNTVESRPLTFVVKGKDIIPLKQLEDFLNEIADYTYRIKGFAVTDKGYKEVSAVSNNIYLNDWDEPVENSEIVVISSVGIRMMTILTKAIEKHLKGIVRL